MNNKLKQATASTTLQRCGGKRRRRLEIALLAPLVVTKPRDKEHAWLDDLTDDEFGDILGPSWFELTGRNADHFIPDHSESAA